MQKVDEFTLREILDMYARGHAMYTIAYELDLDPETVTAAIRKATEQIKEKNREHIEQRFLQQDLVLQRIIQRVLEALEEKINDRLLIGLVRLLDRQARLLGLDRTPSSGSQGAMYQWLNNASTDELIKVAESFGVKIPRKIVDA